MRAAFAPLLPGASYTQTMTYTVPQSTGYGDPLRPGNYFLGVKADESYGSDQPESNERNNERFLPITILPPDVDLVVSSATAPGSADVGETIQVEVTITNLGTETANGEYGRWVDSVFLSDDDQRGSDRSLGYYYNNSDLPLDGGQSYTFTLDVEIPSSAEGGSQFLLFDTDDGEDQVETDETNNLLALPILLSAPNLTITSATAPAVAALEPIDSDLLDREERRQRPRVGRLV